MVISARKIRVAHVITGLGVGGAEMMLVKLLSRLDPEHFESVVVSLSSDLALAERIRESGVDVYSADMRRSLTGGVIGLPRLRARLSSLGADLVQTWMYHADLTGGLAARALGVPTIWNVQAGTLEPQGMVLRTRGLARVCGALSRVVPRRIVSCSYAAVDVHTSIGYQRAKFVVIPNGTDLEHFRPDDAARRAFRAEIGVSDDAPLAGMIARLHPQKDHPVLFRALAELICTHPEVRVVLCGLGLEASNESLVAQLAALGITRNVILLGLRSDVPRVLAGLDLHVLSSSFGEAFPNVLGEAMASGLPCVVTDVGDSALIVGDTGLSVPARQPSALAGALRQMFTMARPELTALGLRARARIAARFSLERSISAYEALYEDVVGR